jgi:anti-sigma factor RsiW
MNCDTAHNKLSAYLDGELPPEGEAAVRAHLAGCEECSRRLRQYRALDGLLGGLEPAPVPADFAAGVRREAERRADQGRTKRVRLFGEPGAAFQGTLVRVAAALMAVAGLSVGLALGQGVSAGVSGDAVTEEETLLELENLSATPPGSVSEAYLAFLGDEDGGTGDDQ